MLLLLFPAFAWGRGRLSAVDVGLILVFANLGLTSVRHVPLFADRGRAAPRGRVAGDRGKVAPASTGQASGQPCGERLPSLAPTLTAPGAPLVAGAVLLLTALSAHWVGMAQVPTNPLRLDLDEGRYPARTMAFIRDNRLPPRLFSVYAWGGYELWRLYPRVPDVHGRAHARVRAGGARRSSWTWST